MRITRRSIRSFDPSGNDHHTVNEFINDTVNSLSDRAYGEMYNYNDDVVINIATTGTAYKVTNMASGELEGFTFAAADDQLTCKSPGMYLITWSIAFFGDVGREIEGTVGVNNVIKTNTGNHGEAAAANRFVAVSGGGLVRLAREDTVQLQVHGHSGTGNITVTHGLLTAVKIDD